MQSLFGPKNVKPNVKYKDLTTGHSTIIEGAQIIVLNELSLTTSKGDLKELSNDFKSFITEPNLIINPKNKPQVEIPNLCNFFVFSNSDTPLYLGETDRRAFVVNIDTTKKEVRHKLKEEGYKEEILKVIKDPSALKWHLENEIDYDREIFFDDAPSTFDKEELIKSNKSDFEKLMDLAFDDQRFPFGNQVSKDGTFYAYKGIVNALHFYKCLKASELFKGLFYKLDDVINYLKSKCIPWNKNKDTTKQIISSEGKIRVYLIHNWKVKGKPLIEMSETELGHLWDVTPEKGDINKFVQEMPNYEDPNIREGNGEDYKNVCWHCTTRNEDTNKMEKTPIYSEECEKCPECNYAYKCSKCGKCECARPGSKIKAQMEAWANRKESF